MTEHCVYEYDVKVVIEKITETNAHFMIKAYNVKIGECAPDIRNDLRVSELEGKLKKV